MVHVRDRTLEIVVQLTDTRPSHTGEEGNLASPSRPAKECRGRGTWRDAGPTIARLSNKSIAALRHVFESKTETM